MSELKIEMWNPEKLVPYELNSKIHDNPQVEKIAKAITQFGFDQPIVVDKDGVIIKGHGRRLASLKLGLKQVPVLVRHDLTPEQVRAARVADNRVALSGIDTDMLQKELADLDFDLTGIFDAKELDFMSADLGEIDQSGFVADLDAELAKQDQQTGQKIKESDARKVKIAKALGFDNVSGKDERLVARFMAEIEHKTGKQGVDAFLAHALEIAG